MAASHGREKQTVAVVGSGMAGLVTAHLLHRDARQRYSVTVFESGDSFSLDSASVSIRDKSHDIVDRIDVPMRAFAEGYYRNLIGMYKYLRVQFHAQRFVYSFEKNNAAATTTTHKTSTQPTDGRRTTDCYFIHSSNNHRLPPIRPRSMNMVAWLVEMAYVALMYFYWSVCCFCVAPRTATGHRDGEETLDEYVRRIMLPRHFVNLYLLPLLSSVATCSHTDLLAFPARDLTEYKRLSAGGSHYTVSGLHEVQKTLGQGLQVRFSSVVSRVEVLPDGRKRLVCSGSETASHAEETFDHVVLAVAPDMVGWVFQPLEKAMAQIPTALVHSVVQGDGSMRATNGPAGDGGSLSSSAPLLVKGAAKAPQTIHFRTSLGQAQTESIHVHPSGATVTTCPLGDTAAAQNVLRSVKFHRAMRTPRSQRVVNDIFGEGRAAAGDGSAFRDEEKESGWRNGDDQIWLVGGWCWDGMVLLEGCVVSAMRVAAALDVDVPWRT